MLIVTVLCAMGAALSYLAQSLRGEVPSRLVFILFCLAGPTLLLILASWLRQLVQLAQPLATKALNRTCRRQSPAAHQPTILSPVL